MSPVAHPGSPFVAAPAEVEIADPEALAEVERARRIIETTREAGDRKLPPDLSQPLPARNPRAPATE